MDQNLYVQVLVAFGLNNYNEAIELISKILGDKSNTVERQVNIVLLNQRATSYFKLQLFTEAFKDMQSSINMGFDIKRDEELLYMYYHAKSKTELSEIINTLEQIKIICRLNSSREIMLLKQINIDKMLNKNDRTRTRSQSAGRK
ncbi:unnamed protein product [Rotaria socialis]|uniref:Uncharacterized protein n=1 Tax=Rotaria socialis TaxID=392032 RepID=A0A821IWV0_9BILA|nr:unnamed protein product [Rotaria socialis]CAF3615497.1 unnamed protein product [Rotaria socialis]CAF4501731.1 unnamed protein product [Rotaria socialis]CAF4707748.1 unnamed protein product [Rotaria socialis]